MIGVCLSRSLLICVTLLGFGWNSASAEEPDSARVTVMMKIATDTSMTLGARIGVLEDVLKYDDSGRVMNAIARLYFERQDAFGRQYARRWIQRAIKREPENATYRLTQARIHQQSGDQDRFYEEVRIALGNDPDNTEALYAAGVYSAREMRMNLERETLRTGPENKKRFNYGQYGQRMREQAIAYLSRLLQLEPDHRKGRFLLAQVFAEGHMLDRLADLFKDWVVRHPNDAEALFLLGLGYQESKKVDEAYEAYTRGLSLVPPEKRKFVKSAVFLNHPDPEERFGLPDDDYLRKFWASRDPLFLTESNERLLEHCRRVAYANLRFAEPEEGIEGWESDRGQVYIRYGHPDARNIYLDRLHYLLLRETWMYPGFSVTFQLAGEDHWTILGMWLQGTVRSKYKDLVERLPEHYEDPYWLDRYEVSHEAAQFRDPDGNTRIELYYAFPGEQVNDKPLRVGVRAVDLRHGLFVFDREWHPVSSEVKPLTQMPWIEGNGVKEGFLFWGERLKLEPGVYHLGVEAEDGAAGTVGTFRDSMRVRSFNGEALQVSDLLVAQRVVEREDRPFGRDRFMVLPNPLKRAQRDGTISFYFEVYNLRRDEFGVTDYRITYQTRLLPEKWREEATMPDWTTAVTNTFKETRPWEPHRLTLDLDGSAPGPWAFRVLVEDAQTGQMASASAVFRVMP